MKFGFIEAEKACYPVTALCEALGVSRSGFYAWRYRRPSRRKLEDERLLVQVLAAFEKNNRRYGSPRIHEELRAAGEHVGRRRVSRLMRQEHLVARTKKRFVHTTQSAHDNPTAPNGLHRDFSTVRPNEKWVGDITYLPTSNGFIYLATLMDLHSRRIVGWAVDQSMETQLPLRALDMALATRRLEGPLIHHTDRGVQYASAEYVARLDAHGITRSMSRKHDCWDNAPAESFFSTLKTELPEVCRGKLHRREVRRVVVDYIAWYNLERRHSSIQYVSPVAFETAVRIGRAA